MSLSHVERFAAAANHAARGVRVMLNSGTPADIAVRAHAQKQNSFACIHLRMFCRSSCPSGATVQEAFHRHKSRIVGVSRSPALVPGVHSELVENSLRRKEAIVRDWRSARFGVATNSQAAKGGFERPSFFCFPDACRESARGRPPWGRISGSGHEGTNPRTSGGGQGGGGEAVAQTERRLGFAEQVQSQGTHPRTGKVGCNGSRRVLSSLQQRPDKAWVMMLA